MLILGSSSIFRKELLERLKIEFSQESPNIDEDSIKSSELSAYEVSRTLSKSKAFEILKRNPEAIVIGSDQVLSFEGEIIGKPKTQEKAFNQLKNLCGKEHQLITSYTVVSKEKEITETVSAHLTMRKLTDECIKEYIKRDDPLYCCGSYKLESLGIQLFERIKCEDHTSIIGLPLIKLCSTLKEFNVKGLLI